MRKLWSLTPLAVVLGVTAGCAEPEPTKTDAPEPSGGATAYLLEEEPEGAVGVIAAREDVKDGDDVVVVGRIGGDANPWVEDRAAFMIADESCTPCNEIPGDACPVPWDYCCEPDLPSKRLLVKVVDEDGDLVKGGAKELFDLTELQTVVVKGKAQRDEDGNLTVLADGVHVRQ